jgi:hypothetical protein
MKLILLQLFELKSSILKLLTTAQSNKRQPNVNHVAQLNGIDRFIGRSVGESEFRSQYTTRSFLESTAWKSIDGITPVYLVNVITCPYADA